MRIRKPKAQPTREIVFEAREPYGVYAAVDVSTSTELVADVEQWKEEQGIDPSLRSELVIAEIAKAFPAA